MQTEVAMQLIIALFTFILGLAIGLRVQCPEDKGAEDLIECFRYVCPSIRLFLIKVLKRIGKIFAIISVVLVGIFILIMIII